MVLFERFAFFTGALLVLLSRNVLGDNRDLEELDQIIGEKECIHQGGLCVIEKDCPKGLLTAVKGLCPQQRHKGIECCYGLSVKETRCGHRGGECMQKNVCSRAPVDPTAQNCQNGEVCCILL